MQTDVTLQETDIEALGRLLRKDETRAQRDRLIHVSRRAILMLAILIVAVMMFGEGDRQGSAMRMVGAFVVLMGLYLVVVHYIGARSAHRRIAEVQQEKRAEVGQTRRVTIKEDGIGYGDPGEEATVPWKDVAEILEDDGRAFVFVRGRLPLIIPHKAFASSTEAKQFLGLARDYIDRSRELAE